MLTGNRLRFHAVIRHEGSWCGRGGSPPCGGMHQCLPPPIVLCYGLIRLPISSTLDGLGPSS
jgi:hypothetical protein